VQQHQVANNSSCSLGEQQYDSKMQARLGRLSKSYIFETRLDIGLNVVCTAIRLAPYRYTCAHRAWVCVGADVDVWRMSDGAGEG
jgi:hypothetical protein